MHLILFIYIKKYNLIIWNKNKHVNNKKKDKYNKK